ncbi:MAG: Type polyketide synthase [Chloroflexi bacterium]|nr:Type polyketide synthase [Chloroflexota bacterium]
MADRGVPTIAATATVTPPFVLRREDVKEAVAAIFALSPRRTAALMAIYDNARVDQRHSVFPLDHLIRPRSLTEKSQEYRKHAVSLGSRAAHDCLDGAGLLPSHVDLLISVSCTGNVRRLPITELGCVGGAAALSRATDFVRAFPDSHVLVVAVELSSLTFQPDDMSDANLISCAFFGDGAAAALVTGSKVAGARVLDTESCLIPDSLDAMGFDLDDTGFHVVLSKDVPDILRRDIRRLVDGFLTRNGLDLGQLSVFVLHPGGRRILEYLEEALDLPREATQPSWDVLRDYGNLSSATIIFVLDEWLRKRRPSVGEYGIAIGFGPGVSAELLLLQWA